MLDRKTADESQSHLLRRIAGQDRQAVAEFYDQTAGILFSTSVRILGDAHDAEEVIQDVFMQIWDKAHTFDPARGAPLHWALGITRNRSIDRLRSRQRRVRLMDELQSASAEDPFPEAEYTRSVLEAEEIAGIHFAVKELPREQRQAIEMAFFGGLSHVEIAETLSEPLGTVKARIRRGMLKLRDSLQPYV
jgi:RNA polymerase sigma-70 factor (ECF subfamily)